MLNWREGGLCFADDLPLLSGSEINSDLETERKGEMRSSAIAIQPSFLISLRCCVAALPTTKIATFNSFPNSSFIRGHRLQGMHASPCAGSCNERVKRFKEHVFSEIPQRSRRNIRKPHFIQDTF